MKYGRVRHNMGKGHDGSMSNFASVQTTCQDEENIHNNPNNSISCPGCKFSKHE